MNMKIVNVPISSIKISSEIQNIGKDAIIAARDFIRGCNLSYEPLILSNTGILLSGFNRYSAAKQIGLANVSAIILPEL